VHGFCCYDSIARCEVRNASSISVLLLLLCTCLMPGYWLYSLYGMILTVSTDPLLVSLAQDVFTVLAKNERCIGALQLRLLPTLLSVLQSTSDKLPFGMQSVSYCSTELIKRSSTLMVVWRSTNTLVSANEVNLRWAWLVLGWVTMSRFDSQGQHFISVCNQPHRSTQLSNLRGR